MLYHERTNRCRTVHANRTRPLEGLLFHFSLDTAYMEDRFTARKGNAMQNSSLLRKFVMNLARLDDYPEDPRKAGRSITVTAMNPARRYEELM